MLDGEEDVARSMAKSVATRLAQSSRRAQTGSSLQQLAERYRSRAEEKAHRPINGHGLRARFLSRSVACSGYLSLRLGSESPELRQLSLSMQRSSYALHIPTCTLLASIQCSAVRRADTELRSQRDVSCARATHVMNATGTCNGFYVGPPSSQPERQVAKAQSRFRPSTSTLAGTGTVYYLSSAQLSPTVAVTVTLAPTQRNV